MSFELLNNILQTDIVQYGDFTLKSGQKDSVYLDFRILSSIPVLFKLVLTELENFIHQQINDDFHSVCGVPYGAVPLATGIAISCSRPLVMCRKETKDYGNKTNQMVISEGKRISQVIIIEDVITTGGSVLETIQKLLDFDNNAKIVGIFCLVDRRPDSDQLLDNKYKIHSMFPFNYIKFYTNLRERHESIRKLYYHAYTKKTRVIASLDLIDFYKIVEIVNAINPYICGIKLHEDILERLPLNARKRLPKDLVIISDRKLADIGEIVHRQMEQLIGEIVTVHAITGPDTLRQLSRRSNLGILLISEMSTNDNLITPEYTEKVYAMAEANKNNVVGFISQTKKRDVPGMIFMTPGVNLQKTTDADQRYRTVKDALLRDGNDFVIVGRGIYDIREQQINDETIQLIVQNAQKYQIESMVKGYTTL